MDRLFRAVIARSIAHRRGAIALVAAILLLGYWSIERLPLDVTPDISNTQVQLLTAVPDLSPEEAEASVTRPIELGMMGLPHLETVRSLTRYGVSQVSLIFAEGTDLFLARQMTTERLAQISAKLPAGLTPRLSPPSTGLGEIFTYALAFKAGMAPVGESEESRLRRLKTLHEFVVKPALRSVPGVAEINTTGGYDREMVVEPDLAKLNQTALDLNDFAQILQRNAVVGGGALVERAGRQVVHRSLARTQTTNDVRGVALRLSWGAAPIALGDVAAVRIGSSPRYGAATLNGNEAVLGTALMMAGENARRVATSFRAALADLETRLPADVELIPLYDRSELVADVMTTLRTNLTMAALLVVTVLFIFLRSFRAAAVVALVLMASFALGVSGMVAGGVMGSLASLGAIDFGVVVDDTIVMIENVARRLGGLPADGSAEGHRRRLAAIADACCQVRKPMLAGMVLIILAYLPLLGLTGVEGRMFRPLAQSVMLVLAGSLLLTVTVGPALCAGVFGSGVTVREPQFLASCRDFWAKVLGWAQRRRTTVLGGLLILAAVALGLGSRLGADFLPRLDEGWLVVEVQRDSHIGLAASLKQELETERAIMADVPEARLMFARIGMSEIATDPQGPNQNDIYIALRPRSAWRQRNGRTVSKAELAELIEKSINDHAPGQELELNQPIAVRFDELLEGVRTDIAVKLFGPDYEALDALATHVAEAARETDGVADVSVDHSGRLDTLEFEPDRASLLRYQAVPDQIDNAIAIGLQGREVGRIDEGDQFYPLVVRLSDQDRENPATLGTLPLRAADGSLVLGLANVGRWNQRERVAAITRENGSRRVAVMITLKNTDAQGFVRRLQERIQHFGPLPAGVRIEYGGAYRNLESGLRRLLWLATLVLALGALLLRGVLGQWRQTVVVLLGAPMAMIGGVAGLWVCALPLTMPAVAAFAALTGLSLLNGVVLASRFNELRTQGMAGEVAATTAARERLRPVLMTALVAGAGFLPMALSQGAGAELQKPFALVIIFGVFSSTLLTLLLLPLILDAQRRPPRKRATA